MIAKKIKSAACAFSVLALLAGCANQGTTRVGDSVALPQRADGVENISISRDRREAGLPTTMYVTLDGQTIGTLSRGESIEFGLDEGRYELGLGCYVSDGRFGPEKWRHGQIPLVVGEESVQIDATSNVSCYKRVSTTQAENRRVEGFFRDGDGDRDYDDDRY